MELQNLKNKNVFLMIAAGVLAFVLMLNFCLFNLKIRRDNAYNATRVHAELQSERVTHIINDKLMYLRALESLAIRDNGDLVNFQSLAASVIGNDACVRCVQFAKNGKITPDTIYPYEGNETGVGDLLSPTSPRYETALMVLEKRTTVLSIPKGGQLHQGGLGLIARRAVFLTDDEGNESFWGFVVLIMDLPAILQQSGFDSTGEVYSYSIHGTDAAGEELLLSGQEITTGHPMELKIKPDNEMSWTLSIMPIDGWVTPGIVAGYLALLFGLVVLVLLLTYFISRAGRFFRMYKSLSLCDELSSLSNKRAFNECLHRLAKGKRPFALYVIDINKFKDFNDTYGHVLGDALIREVAKRIKGTLPADAESFRIGGDEFAVICFDNNEQAAEAMLQSLVTACQQPFRHGEMMLDISVSCGHALFPQDTTAPEELLQWADIHMYQQKNAHSKTLPLSGRDHFFRAINYSIKKARHDGDDSLYYFFHMDYRNFKCINFHYGIAEGDALIRRTIEHIRSHENCVLCGRGNADNVFALVRTRPETGHEEIERIVEEHFERLIQQEQKKYTDVALSLWCGYARVRDTHLIDAVGRANIGKNEAKRIKSLHPVFIDEDRATQFMLEKQLEQEVLLALREGNIRYELQPQIDINTAQMVSAEVLGRMYKKSGETISPMIFVPLLEENGRIVEFDLAIFERVCRDLRQRLDDGLPVVPLSLNLSRVHTASDKTPEQIGRLLETFALPPELFCFEITEMSQPTSGEDIVRFCRALREKGVKVSLDDLGAGDTDISLIKDALVDELKLDRRFLTGDPEQLARHMNVLQSIVQMAQRLNIRVVCEGVENVHQYELVKNAGVSLVQGFYYSKPEDKDTIYGHFLRGEVTNSDEQATNSDEQTANSDEQATNSDEQAAQ